MKSSRLDALKFKYTRCNRMNISYYWSLKITFKAVLQKTNILWICYHRNQKLNLQVKKCFPRTNYEGSFTSLKLSVGCGRKSIPEMHQMMNYYISF